MASRPNTAVALLGRNDGARAQLRQSLEELGASVVFEGDTAGSAATAVLERAPRVVIVNLAENADDDLDHLQPVFDAPDVNVVFNESDVSSRLQGWDLARWARHLAAKVLGDGNVMPPPPPGAEALPLHDLMPSAGKPPTPAQLAPERPIEEFVLEAEDRVDALPEDFLPLADAAHDDAPMQRDTSLDVDFGAVDDAMLERDDAVPAPADIVRIEREADADELPDHIPLPDLGELDRALEAQAQLIATSTRSDRELLDEALGGLDLDLLPDAVRDAELPTGEAAVADTFDPAADVSANVEPDAPDTDAATDVERFILAGDTRADDAQGLDDADAEALAAELAAFEFDDEDAPGAGTAPTPPAVPFGALFLEDDVAPAPVRADDAWTLRDDDDGEATHSVPAAAAAATDAAALSGIPDDWALENDEPEAAPIEGRAVFHVPDAEPAAAAPPADDAIDLADIASDFGFTLEDELADASQPARPAATRDAPSWMSDDTDLQFDEANLDDDVAALAAQLDALDADAPRFEAPADDGFTLEAFDDGDAPESSAVPAAAPARVPAPVAANIDFGSLELTSLDAEFDAAPRAAPGANFDFSNLANLSLEPIEDEGGEGAAPSAGADDPLLMAMGLVEAPAKPRAVPGEIQRVIVLGASIGGPDALRTFLGGIPAGFPALFLLVQHLENGYFERLSQQLQKATKLNVRALAAGAPDAQSGDVLVVPADARYTVERNGVVAAAPHAQAPRYTPCIDDVIRDAADRFGAHTTVIIFSGMAGDAIEGAVHATAKGAQVWAQDPASCVVSSMVDGAKSRGVVEFIGSPRELAEHCVALYGN